MRYLGLIPARGGSKGIPGKNLALLGGRPLIWYTLQAGFQSRLKDSLFLSSDSDEIINYCKNEGLHSPYKRPAALSTDTATTGDLLLHAVEYFTQRGEKPDAIVLLQPTSPFRTALEIDQALSQFEKSGAPSLVGVNRMREHPYECIQRPSGEAWSYLKKSPNNASRRQDYKEDFYFINGALYIFKTESFLQHKRFVAEGETLLFEMSSGNSIDIDDPFDLCMAEAYLGFLKGQ